MDIRFRLAFLLSGLLLLLSLPIASVRADANAPTTAPSPNLLAEYPIQKWDEAIMVPVVWKDKPACFMLDTGASVSVVDSKAFSDLKVEGEQSNLPTAGGKRSFELCSPPDLRVGPFLLGRCGQVQRMDMSDLRAVTGLPVIGVLGISVLDDFVVQIDFDNRKLRFLQHDFNQHPEWGRAVKMEIDVETQKPTLEVLIGGEKSRIAVDTGSGDFACLPTTELDRLISVSKQTFISEPTVTAAGIVPLREVRAGTFGFADEEFHGVIFGETETPFGLLGLDYFERHLVTMDFPGHCIYLKPGKEFDHRSEENMCGLRCAKIGPDLVAKFVDAGSIAEKAGCKAGDVLVELNGKAARDWEIYDVRALLSSEDGKEIVVKFKRDGVEKTATFKLHRVI